MSRLPHVVWDMGGILYHYFAELMVDLGRRRGWPLDRVPLGPTGDLSDPDYRRLVAGELIEPEYVRLVVDRLRAVGIDFDPSTDLDWEGWSRPEVFELIEDIASSGHRQAVLTNDASRWLGEGWWETWEHAAAFDAMVDVETIGVRKPAAAPYLAVAETLGVPPSECLFIDDMPVNVAGAEAVGMMGFLFSVTDPAGSVARLRALLDLPH